MKISAGPGDFSEMGKPQKDGKTWAEPAIIDSSKKVSENFLSTPASSLGIFAMRRDKGKRRHATKVFTRV